MSGHDDDLSQPWLFDRALRRAAVGDGASVQRTLGRVFERLTGMLADDAPADPDPEEMLSLDRIDPARVRLDALVRAAAEGRVLDGDLPAHPREAEVAEELQPLVVAWLRALQHSSAELAVLRATHAAGLLHSYTVQQTPSSEHMVRYLALAGRCADRATEAAARAGLPELDTIRGCAAEIGAAASRAALTFDEGEEAGEAFLRSIDEELDEALTNR